MPFVIDVVKVFTAATLSFFLGIVISVVLSHFLYKYRCWKKKPGKVGLDGNATPLFDALHREREVGTPRMGGIVIWLSTLLSAGGLWLAARLLRFEFLEKLDFLSRNQTWLPLSALIGGAIVGLIDDVREIRAKDRRSGGLSLRWRLIAVSFFGLVIALWFYGKLDISSISLGEFLWSEPLELGILFIPFFIFIMLALYSGGIIDGLDGLAGGIFAVVYTAYGVIAFVQNQINLAAFCASVAGAILAFLWFNIPPARFYMSETGSMALTITLTVVVFMADEVGEGVGVLPMPIIALPLFLTSLSVIVQVLSKRIRGRKVFLVAPLHHHFEAIGWPAYKVTMRYWVISVVLALIGVTIALMR